MLLKSLSLNGWVLTDHLRITLIQRITRKSIYYFTYNYAQRTKRKLGELIEYKNTQNNRTLLRKSSKIIIQKHTELTQRMFVIKIT